jgi:hypothetical protein
VDLNQYVHPVTVFQNKEADRFTFNECIAPPQIPWLRQLRDRLALKTRLKRLLRRGFRSPERSLSVRLPHPPYNKN